MPAAVLFAPQTASATSYSPFLQLEIKNGVYDNTTQSTVATTKAFTLYAYLTPIAGGGVDLATLLDTTYYITAALTPKVDSRQGSRIVLVQQRNRPRDGRHGLRQPAVRAK